MLLLTFAISIFTFLSAFAYADDGINTLDYSTAIYDKLVELGDLNQVAYCIQELDRDAFKTGEFSCAIDYCSQHQNIDVLKIFVAPGNESGSGYILVDNTDKRILVVFRGSQTIFDWIADLTFIATPYTPLTTDGQSNYTCTDCYCHHGFYETLKQFSDEVFPFVKELKEGNYSDYQVVTTGHSLGGALTTLAGIEFLLMGYDPLVISLAGPKAANDKLAEYINNIFDTDSVISDIVAGKDVISGAYLRAVHSGDVVPLLPPTSYFWHAGAEFFIDKFALPFPKSVVYFRGDYDYETITQSELTSYIKVHNVLFIYDHISYFVSMAKCIVADVFTLF
uniref:triacylglycerol lipase n=1 Tax=Nakazawaea ernobii TaxID=1538178 RepID=Q9HDQ8_9ASCO|nr:triacylglycerol lipase [Nakazawaea ernobii]